MTSTSGLATRCAFCYHWCDIHYMRFDGKLGCAEKTDFYGQACPCDSWLPREPDAGPPRDPEQIAQLWVRELLKTIQGAG